MFIPLLLVNFDIFPLFLKIAEKCLTSSKLFDKIAEHKFDKHLICLAYWGYSSVGRAPALQAGGQRFDPAYLHQYGLIAQLVRAPA